MSQDREAEGARETGERLLREAVMHYEAGKFAECLELSEEAERIFVRVGPLVRGLAARQRQAMAWHVSGQLGRALEMNRQLIGVYTGLGDEIGVAQCRTNLGFNLRVLGQYNETLVEFEAARRVFATYPDPGFELAMTHMNLGIVYRLVGKPRLAHGHARRAERLFARIDRGNARVIDCVTNAARALEDLNRVQAADESRDRAETLARALGDRARTAAIQHARAGSLYRRRQFATALDQERQALVELLAAADLNHRLLREMVIGMARLFRELGSARAAWPFALSATHLALREYQSLRRPEERASWRTRHAQVYGLACGLACDLEKWTELALLIEVARAQQPLAEQAADRDPLAALLDPSLVADAHLPLLAMPRVAVGLVELGAADNLRQVLADVIGPVEPGLEPTAVQRVTCVDLSVGAVDLEALRVAIAGPTGALWGTIVLDGWLYWYWIDETGVTGGRTAFTAGSRAGDAMSATLERLPREGLADADNAALVLGASAFLQSVTGRDLADTVLPPQLTASLAGRGRMRVVTVPSAEMARLPLTALRIGGHYLGEHAEFVFCPSPALASHLLRTRSRSVAQHWPVSVGVLDPTGDLTHARQLADLASVRLVGTKRNRRHRSTPATRANLQAALRDVRSTPQTFLYAGHSTGLTTTAGAALQLADGHFAASEWLAPHGRAMYPMPRRVVLLSCSSSGLGAHDWYGLATAAMAAGADTVVCSVWVHADQAEPLDRRVIRDVERCQDVAGGIARTIDRWRDDHLHDPTTPGSSPFIWANYVVISIESHDAARGSE